MMMSFAMFQRSLEIIKLNSAPENRWTSVFPYQTVSKLSCISNFFRGRFQLIMLTTIPWMNDRDRYQCPIHKKLRTHQKEKKKKTMILFRSGLGSSRVHFVVIWLPFNESVLFKNND
jgi:hypothetical protein